LPLAQIAAAQQPATREGAQVPAPNKMHRIAIVSPASGATCLHRSHFSIFRRRTTALPVRGSPSATTA
jgi:hypothetical protein